ncbi:hypothetical protein Hdeb2414_s0008g00288551 [Helianthus debilis subsp. tardiflorus]
MDAPPGYMTLYAAFFREEDFRLPMPKFIGDVLTGYGIHISQVNALGLPRVTHFEFICRAQKIEPTFEMFNVFYYVTYSRGFYYLNLELPVYFLVVGIPQKVFMIGSKNSSISVVELFRLICITGRPTPIIQLGEKALVAAGMSLLWVPRDPRAYPVYAHKGKVRA